MKLVLVLGLFVASVSSFEEVKPRSYHGEVGIPEAERLRVDEELAVSKQGRIVGGILAHPTEHPYLGGLLINLVGTSAISVCGSTLVNANRLVTAAHCWYDGVYQASQFTVVLGTNLLFSGGTRITTSQVHMFGSWNPQTLNHDIAMIYLPSNVALSNSIQPIALPSGIELFLTFENFIGVAAGYGRTSDQQVGIPQAAAIRQVSMQIVSIFDCQALYGFNVNEWNICTNGQGGVGICGGDSGGPLYVISNGRKVLVGVASFNLQNACQASFPSGFTRTTSYINFIQSHL